LWKVLAAAVVELLRPSCTLEDFPVEELGVLRPSPRIVLAATSGLEPAVLWVLLTAFSSYASLQGGECVGYLKSCE
jgi:hypothetical protein